MKHLLLSLFVALLPLAVSAQGVSSTPQTPPPVYYSVNFVSQHGETFCVYIDGNLQNRMPQGRVLVNDVSDQVHEVVVVMKRPTDKAAVLQLRPGEKVATVNVNYDPRLGQLYLYTAAHNRPDADQRAALRDEAKRVVELREASRLLDSATVAAPERVRGVTDDELDSMVVRMRAQRFDNERLALGKVIVASSHLNAAQIAILAQTIDFSSSQVEFLKYSYGYCIDPVNYHRTIEVLTFSSDKRKVLDYIATQR